MEITNRRFPILSVSWERNVYYVSQEPFIALSNRSKMINPLFFSPSTYKFKGKYISLVLRFIIIPQNWNPIKVKIYHQAIVAQISNKIYKEL